MHAVHTEANSIRFSRRLKSFQIISRNPDEQLAYIERFGRAHGGFLLPTNDDYLALVSQNRERLARYFTIPLPGWDVVWSLLNRTSAYAMAASVGICVPLFWAPETETEMRQAVCALELDKNDYILKTRSVLSVPADEKTVRQTKPAARNEAEILSACIELKRRTGNYPLIEQVVPGSTDCSIGVSMVVGPHGDFILTYCVRRLRLARYRLESGYVHPYELGSVLWCETCHDDEAVEAARALITRSGYTGVVTVEFRRDARDNSLFLTKIEQRTVRATSAVARHRDGYSDRALRGFYWRLSERCERLSRRHRLGMDSGLCRGHPAQAKPVGIAGRHPALSCRARLRRGFAGSHAARHWRRAAGAARDQAADALYAGLDDAPKRAGGVNAI